jgi:hypothetical protein
MIVWTDHAWDKAPTFEKLNPKRDEMYSEASTQLIEMFSEGK